MNCPDCKNIIDDYMETCPHCSCEYNSENLEFLRIYFELRDEFRELKEANSYFNFSLQKFENRIKNYGDIVSEKLMTQEKSSQIEKEDKPVMEENITEKIIITSPPVKKEQKLPVINVEELKKESIKIKKGIENLYSETKEKTSDSSYELVLGQKWMLIIGLITMIFGIGYFLKYSFDQGWVTPGGKVAIAYSASFILLAVSKIAWKNNYNDFSLNLCGGGIAFLYFSTWAAFAKYNLITQAPAFILMVGITVFAGYISVSTDKLWLSILGIIGGFLTPVLLSQGTDNQIILMSYMTILNIGILGIAFNKNWSLLNNYGFVFTYLLFSGWFINNYPVTRFWLTLFFLNLFFILYIFAPLGRLLFRKENTNNTSNMILLFNSFIAFGFNYHIITNVYSNKYAAIVSILYAVILLNLASVLHFKSEADPKAIAMLTGLGSLFCIITIPLLFSNHWITAFWSIQAFILYYIGGKIKGKNLVSLSLILLLISISKFFVWDYSEIFKINVFEIMYTTHVWKKLAIERILLSLTITLFTALFGYHLSISRNREFIKKTLVLSTPFFYSLTGIILFAILNIETAVYFRNYLPTAVFASISVLWTLFSAILMITGFRFNNALCRKVSIVLFSFTLLKVFVFDMEKLSTPYRIISFIVLGLVLVLTSFLYHKFKDKFVSDEK